MSPQPIEMHTSPGRASVGDETHEVVPARQPHQPLLGMGLVTAFTSSLPVTPGIGVVPDAVDVGEHDDVGIDERVGVVGPDLGDAVVPVRLEHRDDALPASPLARARRRARRRSRSAGGRSRRRTWHRRSMPRMSNRRATPPNRASAFATCFGSTPTAIAIAAAPVALTTLCTPRSGSRRR